MPGSPGKFLLPPLKSNKQLNQPHPPLEYISRESKARGKFLEKKRIDNLATAEKRKNEGLNLSSSSSSSSSRQLITFSLRNSGNEFLAAKKYDDAARLYGEAIQLNPSNAIYYSNRSQSSSLFQRSDLVRSFPYTFLPLEPLPTRSSETINSQRKTAGNQLNSIPTMQRVGVAWGKISSTIMFSL